MAKSAKVLNAKLVLQGAGPEIMLALGVRHFRLEFLNETPGQVAQTISQYRQLLEGRIQVRHRQLLDANLNHLRKLADLGQPGDGERIDPQRRAETVSVPEFVAIARILSA